MVKTIKWQDVPKDIKDILAKVEKEKVSGKKLSLTQHVLTVGIDKLKNYIRFGKVVFIRVPKDRPPEDMEFVLKPGYNFNCFPPTLLELYKTSEIYGDQYVAKPYHFAYELNEQELQTVNNFLDEYFKPLPQENLLQQ